MKVSIKPVNVPDVGIGEFLDVNFRRNSDVVDAIFKVLDINGKTVLVGKINVPQQKIGEEPAMVNWVAKTQILELL